MNGGILNEKTEFLFRACGASVVPPEYLHPLEHLDLKAFSDCDAEEIFIPASVQSVDGHVFRASYRPQVKKLIIRNLNLRFAGDHFDACRSLQEVHWENGMDPIRKMRVLGLPFLMAHLGDEANLNHTSDPRFFTFAGKCAVGNIDAILDENFCPIPGISKLYANVRDKMNTCTNTWERFQRAYLIAKKYSKRPLHRKHHNLERFVKAQDCMIGSFETAVKELESGKKKGDWMLYVFPGRISAFSRIEKYYQIGSIDLAKAYLQHPVLAERLIRISTVLMTLEDKNPNKIFGETDASYLNQSMTLFELAAGKQSIFSQVIDAYFAGKRNKWVLECRGKD